MKKSFILAKNAQPKISLLIDENIELVKTISSKNILRIAPV